MEPRVVEVRKGRFEVHRETEDGRTVVMSGRHSTREKALRDAANRIIADAEKAEVNA